jgi:hypothetical protein
MTFNEDGWRLFHQNARGSYNVDQATISRLTT